MKTIGFDLVGRWCSLGIFLTQACGSPTGVISAPAGENTSAAPTNPTNPNNPNNGPSGDLGITWKSVLVAGDHSIDVFDNARKSFKLLWLGYGVEEVNIAELSADSGEMTNGVTSATIDGIEGALTGLSVGTEDGCVVHMSSHGSKDTGIYLSRDQHLTPPVLNTLLTAACGAQPTVVLISACYSGFFVNDLRADNRIILTATREDKTSFGCSPEAEYTYWDGCLLQSFEQARTWSDVYDLTTGCIEKKESTVGQQRSYPQSFFGADVEELCVFECEDDPVVRENP